ncbi:hypothetical protein ACQZM9_07090 [Streptomyces sp. P11-1]|uniref:hypothetical protein n=1 Tax=Streptomyces sp. P11-1 TaxID=3423221 RepID=UPI003D2EB00A
MGVLADLSAGVLERLADPADSYKARPEADRDLGALVELFRVQLARMRMTYADHAELVRAMHAYIEGSEEEQAARRRAFVGWYVATYGDVEYVYEEALGDLEFDEDAWDTDPLLDLDFSAGAAEDWRQYRNSIRRQVPLPALSPTEISYGRGRHWYYEFRTMGRRLTEHQIRDLRARLPWADVTPTSLVLDQWSHQTEHPIFNSAGKIVSEYFDAGLYFSQEGSRTLWLRVPSAAAPLISPYETMWASGARTTALGDDLLLELHRQEADGENSYLYVDPRTWLEDLLPLREDVARGDTRAPAIAWRAAFEADPPLRAPEKPPMPGGLDEDELSPQLHALVRLLEEEP